MLLGQLGVFSIFAFYLFEMRWGVFGVNLAETDNSVVNYPMIVSHNCYVDFGGSKRFRHHIYKLYY